jgi:hypothetical protein
MGAAMLVEIVLTMFLVLRVLGSTDLKAPGGICRSCDRSYADADSLAAVVYGAMRIPGETITPREAERALKSQQAERTQRAAVGKTGRHKNPHHAVNTKPAARCASPAFLFQELVLKRDSA